MYIYTWDLWQRQLCREVGKWQPSINGVGHHNYMFFWSKNTYCIIPKEVKYMRYIWKAKGGKKGGILLDNRGKVLQEQSCRKQLLNLTPLKLRTFDHQKTFREWKDEPQVREDICNTNNHKNLTSDNLFFKSLSNP